MKDSNYAFQKLGYQAKVQYKLAEKVGLTVPECLIWAKECSKDRRKSKRYSSKGRQRTVSAVSLGRLDKISRIRQMA